MSFGSMPAPGADRLPNGRSPLIANTTMPKHDEGAPGDVVGPDDHDRAGVIGCWRHPSTLPIERTASSTRLASASQNALNSGWSR